MNDKVKTIGELRKAIAHETSDLDGCLEAYEASRGDGATEEERFNEGRYGRTTLEVIDRAQTALTQLRMRVQLQLDGRDSARAKQLDRILGIAEEDDDGGGEDE